MAFNISYRFQVLDGFSKNISKLRRRVKKVRIKFVRLGRAASAAFKKVQAGANKARSAMTGLSVGVAAFGFVAGRSIVDFQTGMNKLEAASRATKGEMFLLRKTARDLGRTTEFTAGNAAFAMAELGKAGFNARQNMEAIPGVLSLASAGSLGLAEAAGIAAGTLKGFGLETAQMIRVADVLALASASAKTTVSEMGQALSQVGPIAKTVGIDLETTSAALAVFQDQNIGAARAGTGLRGIIAKLSKFTPEASKAFRKMGISTKQVAADMKKGDIIGIFEKFSKAGLDAKKASQIFGLETLTTALAFAGSTKEIRKMTAELRKAEGTSKRMADTQLQGLPGAIKIAQSSFESFQLKLGEVGLTKRFTQIGEGVKNMSNAFENMDPALLGAIVDLGIVFVAVTALLVPFAALGGTLSLLAPVIEGIIFTGIVGGLTGLILPISVALLAIGRLITKWDDLKATFRDEGFSAAFKEFLGFKDALPALDKTIAQTKKLEATLTRRGIKFNRAPNPFESEENQAKREDLQNRLASRAPATDVNLNGNINVSSSGNTAVDSAELSFSGAGGDLGVSLAGGI